MRLSSAPSIEDTRHCCSVAMFGILFTGAAMTDSAINSSAAIPKIPLFFAFKFFPPLFVPLPESGIEVRHAFRGVRSRAACAPFKYMKRGKSLRFVCGRDSLVRVIRDVRRYPSFEERLDYERLDRLAPGLTVAQTLAIYRSIYTAAKEAAGVLVFSLSSNS